MKIEEIDLDENKIALAYRMLKPVVNKISWKIIQCVAEYQPIRRIEISYRIKTDYSTVCISIRQMKESGILECPTVISPGVYDIRYRIDVDRVIKINKAISHIL